MFQSLVVWRAFEPSVEVCVRAKAGLAYVSVIEIIFWFGICGSVLCLKWAWFCLSVCEGEREGESCETAWSITLMYSVTWLAMLKSR